MTTISICTLISISTHTGLLTNWTLCSLSHAIHSTTYRIPFPDLTNPIWSDPILKQNDTSLFERIYPWTTDQTRFCNTNRNRVDRPKTEAQTLSRPNFLLDASYACRKHCMYSVIRAKHMYTAAQMSNSFQRRTQNLLPLAAGWHTISSIMQQINRTFDRSSRSSSPQVCIQ